MAERPRKARRRAPRRARLDVAADGPVPLAMAGPRTRAERTLALTFAASMLASAALAGCGAPPPQVPRAPDCPPPGASGSWAAIDLDGCWEKGKNGGQRFRTFAGGHYYYHAAPPGGSRYSVHAGVGG